MRQGAVIILMLTITGSHALGGLHCPKFLSRLLPDRPPLDAKEDPQIGNLPRKIAARRPVNEVTSEFMGYLGTLLEKNLIGNKELAHLIASLENGSLSNPISKEDAQINSSLHIHREGLARYIESGQVDRAQLLEWAQATLQENGRVQVRRNDTRVETQRVYQPMTFNRIEPGKFKMGEKGKKVKVTISKPFEMMSTPVTQRQWSDIMGDNPSQFIDGENANFDGKQIRMQPDNPVEQVSWEDIQNYILQLNELSQKDDQRLYQLISGHQKGDQYRLPTEAEWEYVVRDRGRANGTYHFGDEGDLRDYGWYGANSGRMTHPVAQLKPLIVDGKLFYDLHGNVWEWVQDWHGNFASGRKVTDPTGPTLGSFRVLRGGAWCSDAQFLRSTFRIYHSPGDRSSGIGFRLVRIRP